MADAAAPRLYLQTPDRIDPERFAGTLAGVLAAVPVACVRLDLFDADQDAWTRAVNHMMPVCHGADVPLVVTDQVALVERLGLDGVHLYASRTPLSAVRQQLGRDRIVGGFAGNTRHQGMLLGEVGADYVSFGPIAGERATEETRAPDALFAWWAEMMETPSVAEGGVHLGDAVRLSDIADFIVPDPAIWDDPAGVIPALSGYAEALA